MIQVVFRGTDWPNLPLSTRVRTQDREALLLASGGARFRGGSERTQRDPGSRVAEYLPGPHMILVNLFGGDVAGIG